MGERQQNGFVFIDGPGGTTIFKFAEELRDEEIIYIPSSLRSYWLGKPKRIILSNNMWNGGLLASSALKTLYVTGNQTLLEEDWYDNLDNLEMVVFNTLSPTYLPDLYPHTTLQDVLQYGFFKMYSHEAYDWVVQYYFTLWDSKYGLQDWEPYVGIRESRASYYYNYDNSPNEGLYRIGMEYVLGADLTPPDDPTRIKHQNLFSTEYYTFKGWSSDATTFIPYDFESSDDDINVQLYAHWE